jgi:hypothetical protein
MKCVFFLWSQRTTSLDLKGWAQFVALRRFLLERGARVSVYFTPLQPLKQPKPDWLAAFVKVEKVPLEEFGELRNWRGMGVIALGNAAAQQEALDTLGMLFKDAELQTVLEGIETRVSGDDPERAFGVFAAEAFEAFQAQRIGDHLDVGHAWTDEEINAFNRNRTALARECLRLLEEELFAR